MDFDKLDHTQKQDLREILAALEAPVQTDAQERFFASVIVYLFGASFEHTTKNPGGHDVHGVRWDIDGQKHILVAVVHLEHAYEHAKEGKYSFAYHPSQLVQTAAIIGYLREHFPDDIVEPRTSQLAEAVTLLQRQNTAD